MMNKSLYLKKALLRLLSENHGGRFFIFRTNFPDATPAHLALVQWTKELIGQYLLDQKLRPQLIQEGSDILWVGLDLKRGQEYTQEMFDEFWNFLKWGSFEIPQRFVIICHATSLTTSLGNKLLKTLEEPRPNTNLILLCEDSTPLLSTLESRAIKLSIPLYQDIDQSSNSEAQDVIQKLKSQEWTVGQAIEWAKSGPEQEISLISSLLDWQLKTPQSFQAKHSFLEDLKREQVAERFHQNKSPYLFALLSCILQD